MERQRRGRRATRDACKDDADEAKEQEEEGSANTLVAWQRMGLVSVEVEPCYVDFKLRVLPCCPQAMPILPDLQPPKPTDIADKEMKDGQDGETMPRAQIDA